MSLNLKIVIERWCKEDRENRVWAKAALEPESRITRKGGRRREKVWLSDAGK